MAVVFLDTSAFLKLYFSEKGSTWLTNFVAGQQLVITQLTLAESATTLGRLYREGVYTRREAAKFYARIYQERYKYDIVALTPQHLDRVPSLALNLPASLRLRSLDAIHLVVARQVHQDMTNQTPPEPFTFVSSDLQLLRVAQALGFPTENPEDHP